VHGSVQVDNQPSTFRFELPCPDELA